MIFRKVYVTPEGLDNIILLSDGEALTSLVFENSRSQQMYDRTGEEKNLPVFGKTAEWLDIYFSGGNPGFTPEYKLENLSPFTLDVVSRLTDIPYGETVTYGDIAAKIAEERGIKKMSAQAVGGAVGRNPICIIIPCHRVVGADGSMTGYGGGINNKKYLLDMEKGLL